MFRFPLPSSSIFSSSSTSSSSCSTSSSSSSALPASGCHCSKYHLTCMCSGAVRHWRGFWSTHILHYTTWNSACGSHLSPVSLAPARISLRWAARQPSPFVYWIMGLCVAEWYFIIRIIFFLFRVCSFVFYGLSLFGNYIVFFLSFFITMECFLVCFLSFELHFFFFFAIFILCIFTNSLPVVVTPKFRMTFFFSFFIAFRVEFYFIIIFCFVFPLLFHYQFNILLTFYNSGIRSRSFLSSLFIWILAFYVFI